MSLHSLDHIFINMNRVILLKKQQHIFAVLASALISIDLKLGHCKITTGFLLQLWTFAAHITGIQNDPLGSWGKGSRWGYNAVAAFVNNISKCTTSSEWHSHYILHRTYKPVSFGPRLNCCVSLLRGRPDQEQIRVRQAASGSWMKS